MFMKYLINIEMKYLINIQVKYLINIHLEMLPRKDEIERTRGREDFRSKGRNAW